MSSENGDTRKSLDPSSSASGVNSYRSVISIYKGIRTMDVLRSNRQKNPLTLGCFFFVRCLGKSVAVLGKDVIKTEDMRCLEILVS